MAFSFNGSNQYLTLFSAVATSAPVTMSCWINLTTLASTYTALALDEPLTYRSFRLQIAQTTGRIRALLVNDVGDQTAFSETSGGAVAGSWVHCVARFDSSSSRFSFLNGTKSAENTTTFTIGAPGRTIIGATSGSLESISQFTNGQIAEAAIWNVALTDAEIASLAAGFTPDQIRPQSLQFYAPLVRNLVDVRGGRTITNVNSATVATHPRIIT